MKVQFSLIFRNGRYGILNEEDRAAFYRLLFCDFRIFCQDNENLISFIGERNNV